VTSNAQGQCMLATLLAPPVSLKSVRCEQITLFRYAFQAGSSLDSLLNSKLKPYLC